jgi:hypothetical protein
MKTSKVFFQLIYCKQVQSVFSVFLSSGSKIKRSLDDNQNSRHGAYRGWSNSGVMLPEDVGNAIDQEHHATCRLRFQQSPVEVG